ncbi:MAG: amino acid ABC transporter permease [Actinomycetota bacterium]
MKTEPKGAGSARPPVPSAGGRMDRFSMASARVPFAAKLTLVWIGIFIVLGVLLSLIDFDWEWIREHWSYIAKGITYTVIIAAGAIVLAIVMALLGALGRVSRNPIAFGVSGFYASFFRGTPLILQLFLIYQALPQVGAALGNRTIQDLLTMEAVQAGILGLGLNYGAYMTEIFRAGIQSVGHAQSEAADALGMTYPQKMRRVVLPQAVRVIIPPTGNEFIAMMKDTALVSFLGITAQQAEIFRRAQLLGREDFRFLEALLVAAGAYWLLTSVFSYFQGRLERRLSKGYIRAAATPAAKSKMFTTAGGSDLAALATVPDELEGGAGPAPKDDGVVSP